MYSLISIYLWHGHVEAGNMRPSTAIVGPCITGIMDDQVCQSTRYSVQVRALHALDLPQVASGRGCPTVSVSVNLSEKKTATAVQHAKNHSIWNRHYLNFKLDGTGEWFCVHVSVLQSRAVNEVELAELGSVGELRLPVKDIAYEVTRFFPLYRHARAASAGTKPSASTLLVPAGKIKLRIQFEIERTNTGKPPVAPVGRPVGGIQGGFLESLQIQRKKLKATVVPVDNPECDAGKATDIGSDDKMHFAREIAQIQAEHIIDIHDVQNMDQGVLGEGVHSRVRRAMLVSADRHDLQVAVKEFQYVSDTFPPRKVLEAFLLEYRILGALPKGTPNVIGLVGVIVRPKLAIVMELCSNGR